MSRRLEFLARQVLVAVGAAVTLGCLPDDSGNRGPPSPRDVYPPGPYGVNVGDTVADLEFVNPDATAFRLGDVFADPHHRVLVVSTAAGWCSACVEEQPALQRLHEEWAGRGLYVLVAVFENAQYAPADGDYAGTWKDAYGVDFGVVADPTFALSAYYPNGDTSASPLNMAIDVDTMTLQYLSLGVDQSSLEAVIEAGL